MCQGEEAEAMLQLMAQLLGSSLDFTDFANHIFVQNALLNVQFVHFCTMQIEESQRKTNESRGKFCCLSLNKLLFGIIKLGTLHKIQGSFERQ